MEKSPFEKSSAAPAEEKQKEETEKMELRTLLHLEYMEGKKPFEYSFTFPGGEKLEAFQDDKGIGRIEIQRGKEVIFDAAKLLPEGWKFVTPTHTLNYPIEVRFAMWYPFWSADFERKFILLGEFESAKDFLSLLHEIGHVRKDTPKDLAAKAKIAKMLKVAESKAALDSRDYIALNKEKARLYSNMERRAWAWALLALRKIQKETGVDFGTIFPTAADFKNHINDFLASYRQNLERLLKKYDPDFHDEFARMFDKKKYGRPR